MKLNLHNTELVRSAADPSGFIRDRLPVVAFAGRSNVGKSSTINALLNRKSLARVSETPGKTNLVNYYLIDRKLYLVDLPGYGFAKTSKAQKAEWGALMEAFFADREHLTLCVLIVDARHKPTADDVSMKDYLSHTGIPYFVAANKADKLKSSELDAQMRLIRETLELDDSVGLVSYSARTKSGVDRLRGMLFKYLG